MVETAVGPKQYYSRALVIYMYNHPNHFFNMTSKCISTCIYFPVFLHSLSYDVSDCTVSPRGHLFYVDFLFFIFTSHRGEKYSHRGGNVLTAVGMFSPRWEYFSPRWEYFSPRWECSHRGGNVLTAVETFPPR